MIRRWKKKCAECGALKGTPCIGTKGGKIVTKHSKAYFFKIPKEIDPDQPFDWPTTIRRIFRQHALEPRPRWAILSGHPAGQPTVPSELPTPREISRCTQYQIFRIRGLGRVAFRYIDKVIKKAGLSWSQTDYKPPAQHSDPAAATVH